MKCTEQYRRGSGVLNTWSTTAVIAIATFLMIIAPTVAAQTYNVIYSFSGCGDGYYPTSTQSRIYRQ